MKVLEEAKPRAMHAHRQSTTTEVEAGATAAWLVLALFVATATTLSLAIDRGVGSLALLLVAAFIASAVCHPPLWRRFRMLPLVVAATLGLATLALAAAGQQLLRLSVTEISVCVLSAWLIGLLVRRSASADNISANVRSVGLHRIGSSEQLGAAVLNELLRSRRNGREFAVVVVGCAQPLAGFSDERLECLDDVLGSRTRYVDRIFFGTTGNEVIVLCPDTGKQSVSVFVERLREVFATQQLGVTSIGCAVFPHDALTGEDLLAAARANAGQDTTGMQPGGAVDGRERGLDFAEPGKLYGAP